MKKVLWAMAGVMLCVGTAFAQVYYSSTGFQRLQNAVSVTGNGSTLDASSSSMVVYQVSGTYTATVTFEGTLDGTNYNNLNCQAGLSSTVVSSTTTNGFFFCPTNGVLSVRGRVTWTSGTSVTVNANATSAPAVQLLTSISGLTSPSITTGINDTNGSTLFKFTASASSVNGIAFANAQTSVAPTILPTGSDGSIGLWVGEVGTAGYVGLQTSGNAPGIHLVSKQGTPPTTNGGTSRVMTGSTDLSGLITANSIVSTSGTVTFGSAWPVAPWCFGQALDATGAQAVVVGTETTTTFQWNGTTSGNRFKYYCTGPLTGQ